MDGCRILGPHREVLHHLEGDLRGQRPGGSPGRNPEGVPPGDCPPQLQRGRGAGIGVVRQVGHVPHERLLHVADGAVELARSLGRLPLDVLDQFTVRQLQRVDELLHHGEEVGFTNSAGRAAAGLLECGVRRPLVEVTRAYLRYQALRRGEFRAIEQAIAVGVTPLEDLQHRPAELDVELRPREGGSDCGRGNRGCVGRRAKVGSKAIAGSASARGAVAVGGDVGPRGAPGGAARPRGRRAHDAPPGVDGRRCPRAAGSSAVDTRRFAAGASKFAHCNQATFT